MKLKKLKRGERLSATYYLEVLDVDDHSISVRDHNNVAFVIKGRDLIENTLKSASQYSKTIKVSRTELVEKLMHVKDSVFTACFKKQDNTNREIVARLLNTENHMGRSNVVDLEAETKNNIRQVDHRTLNWLIVDDVKYEVKK